MSQLSGFESRHLPQMQNGLPCHHTSQQSIAKMSMDIPTYLVTPASKVSPGVDEHSSLPCHTSQQSICRWTSPPTLSHQPAKYRQVSMDFLTYFVTPTSKVLPGVDGFPHLPCHTNQQSIARCRWISPPTLSHQPTKYRGVSMDIPTYLVMQPTKYRGVSMDIPTYLVTPASKVSPGCR
jgi:hypothetical protein